MSNIPTPGQLYRHFKGNLYRIVTLAKDSETGENMVVYQALYGDYEVYVRELSMFMEKVDRNKYPNVVQEYRFELQKELVGGNVSINAETEPLMKKAESQEEETEETIELSGKSAETAKEKAKEAEAVKGEPVTEAAEKTEDIYRMEGTASEDTQDEEELNIDPLVLEFLDAGTYGERLNILSALHHRITDEMITTMAIATDLEVGDGDVEERYEELRSCLLTYERYEGRRLR